MVGEAGLAAEVVVVEEVVVHWLAEGLGLTRVDHCTHSDLNIVA